MFLPPHYVQDRSKSLDDQIDQLTTRCMEIAIILSQEFTDPDGRRIMVDHKEVLQSFHRLTANS